MNYHTSYVSKITELENNQLVSCSGDNSVIFYVKENNEYKKDYKISTNGECSSVTQTQNYEICYSEKKNNAICFFDFFKREIKQRLNNISEPNGYLKKSLMIAKDLLLIGGKNKLSIINIK